MTGEDFALVAKLLRERSAIALEPGKEYLVESRLSPVATRHGVTLAEYIARLRNPLASRQLMDEVIEAMVTTETSFFRDVFPFDTLRKKVLPLLIEARRSERKLAIWCAAAASGQEPYTIAIILREYFPELRHWNITLLATDLSRTMVERCQAGVFSQLEVNRGLPAPLLMKYFHQQGNTWTIHEDIRSLLQCRQMNLISPWPDLPLFDLIFLRNVMIYFEVETKRVILQRMQRILKPDGYLILGGAETTLNLCDGFSRVEEWKSGYFRRAVQPGPTSTVRGTRHVT